MKPQRDFFDEDAYREDEYANLHKLFDSSVRQFAKHLYTPLGNILRRELSGEIASGLVEPALTALSTYLGKDSQEKLSEEARNVLTEIKGALSEKVSGPEIEAEIESCCRVLSQSVLTRWYSVLSKTLQTEAHVPLSPLMLPAGETLEAALRRVDFESFGIDPPVVMAALLSYQDELADESVASKRPIEIGTRMFIVRRQDNPHLPYCLIRSPKEARSIASEQGKLFEKQTTLSLEAIAEKIRDTAEQIGSFLGVPHIPDPMPATEMFANAALCMGEAAGRHAFISYNTKGGYRIAEREEVFGSMVMRGLDAMSCNYASGGYDYSRCNAAGETIQRQLQSYADITKVPISAVRTLFVLSLATAVEARSTMGPFKQGTRGKIQGQLSERQFQPSPEKVASDFHVTKPQGQILMKACIAGFAFGSGMLDEVYSSRKP